MLLLGEHMERTDSISKIKGIGEKTQKCFTKLDIFTIEDMIEHYPKGYDSYEPLVYINEIEEETVVAIEATIQGSIEFKRVRNLQIINARVKDQTGSMLLTWFNMPFLRNSLKIGTKIIFRGKAIRKNGILVIEQPQILSKQEYVNRLNLLQPMYPLCAGITNNAITKAIKTILSEIDLSGDYLPLTIRKEYDLMDYKTAVKGIHFPKNKEQMIQARKRIVFDEFFLFLLALNQLKKQKSINKSEYILTNQEECSDLLNSLPYALTKAQEKVWMEIKGDLTSGKIMNRLVQGDVGSGKTILAVLALLMVVKNGYQGAIMVPTEVLAKQHYDTLAESLSKYNINIVLLVGSMTAKEKKETYEQIKMHQAHIIVGTHALIQEKVEYDSLALVITDEQHRFGVRQREAFSNKGMKPHILVMSATPIPRTLAIILYGDLDLSVINELPANRLPIKNCVVNSGYRKAAYQLMEKEAKAGRQAYIICPMVEESETMEAENVIDYTQQLKSYFPEDIHAEYLHGKMKPKEKNEIMERFASGEIQILISTTVVEVGVNVPNATVIMIENAERFGLAQLHQLRGRVGRGSHQSYCILVSDSKGKETKQRLDILNHSNDGFHIAGEDLKLRGPGDLFGIRQSGMLEFRMADVFNDASILQEAQEAANHISQDEVIYMYKKYDGIREKLNLYAQDVFL
jgi:ATP-dependent DNA helicase RecG